jgi:anti-sigma factor ChrR (cupin superfamily)
MSSPLDKHGPDHTERLYLYAVQALPADEATEVEAHIANCADCRRELKTLHPVVDAFVAWPTDVLRPSASLWDRLKQRVSPGQHEGPRTEAGERWKEPEWEQVAPGISVKLLANDTERHMISMLVRLEPGASYPPHTHAGVEELHLLHGELWIEDRKLYPGDYNLGQPGAGDTRVYSETGCTCVLVTSTLDKLR